MLDSETSATCKNPGVLATLRSTSVIMGENGCHQEDVNGKSSPTMSKHSTPNPSDVVSFSPFQSFEQTSSPRVPTTGSVMDPECSNNLDTTGAVSQDSSNCSRPASRAVTPLVPQDVSPPTLSTNQSDSPLVNTNHVTPRRPRHKPGERRELLIRAVDDVINLKISMRRAAQKYNLAKSSLCDFVRKNKICLPNLRYKSCATAPGNVPPSTNRASSGGSKHTAVEGEHSNLAGTTPQKLHSGVDHKLNVPSTEAFHSGDLSFDSGTEQIQHGDNISVASWSEVKTNMLEFMNNVSRNAAQFDPTQTTCRIPSNLNFCKPGRIESPWHNSAGLPTQVPMRSWSTHSSQSINASPSNSISSANPGRKLPFNSLNQLRQTVESSQTAGPLSSEAMDLSDSNTFPITSMNSSLEDDGHFGRSSENLYPADSRSPSVDFRNRPVSTNHNSESVADNQLPTTAPDLQTRLCATPNKSNGAEHVSSPGSLQYEVPNSFVHQSSNEHGSFGQQQQQRTSKGSSVTVSSENQVNSPLPVNPSAAAAWSVSQPSFLGAFPPVLSTAPCSSLASILSADFASLNQNPVAAFLLQHSRSLASAPPAVGSLPGFINYPASQSMANTPAALLANDFSLPLNQTQVSPSNSRSPCTSTTTRLSNGSAASALNTLATQLWNADLCQQANTMEELQQLLCRHLQSSRFPTDITNSSFLSPLANHLIPQLYASCTNPSLRHLVTGLLNSSTTQNQPTPTQTTPSKSQSTTVNSSVNRPDDVQPNTTPSYTIPTTVRTIPPSISSLKMNKLHPHARGLVDFINNSPSPFHAVQTACELLATNGFRELKESEPWKLKPRDCVFWKKNGSTLFAAAIGGQYTPGNGFHLLGAHTDSPSLLVKPVSNRIKEGYVQLGVETYGGGLWYTWFDRELKIAGRVVTANASGRLEEHLVHIDQPIACVPSLAIHLNPEIRTAGFNPNAEQHLVPVLCTTLMDQVNKPDQETAVSMDDSSFHSANESDSRRGSTASSEPRHPPSLIRALAQQLKLGELPNSIELELYLSDFQPARIGGLYEEFIHAPRLDNLFNAYAAVHGLLESITSLSDETAIRIVCLYDHEEVGSTSTQGADSSYTINMLRRLTNALTMDSKHTDTDEPMPSVCLLEETLSKSFLLSADQSHAVHPSYPDKHELLHKPQLHGGLVLKCNVNQRYATNALTAAAVRQIAHLADIPLQEYVNRQDMPCGSTIGPLLSSQLGVPTADVGFPQLAMHSCREFCSTTSATQAVRFYSAYFEHMSKIWPPVDQ